MCKRAGSDILGPFCPLGRRHLERALEQFEHRDEVGVVWHSFQLDRTADPVDDAPVIDRVAAKYGVPREQMVAQHEQMARDAASVGLDFQWEKPVSYTHLRAHETVLDLVCRLLLEKKKTSTKLLMHTFL